MYGSHAVAATPAAKMKPTSAALIDLDLIIGAPPVRLPSTAKPIVLLGSTADKGEISRAVGVCHAQQVRPAGRRRRCRRGRSSRPGSWPDPVAGTPRVEMRRPSPLER